MSIKRPVDATLSGILEGFFQPLIESFLRKGDLAVLQLGLQDISFRDSGLGAEPNR